MKKSATPYSKPADARDLRESGRVILAHGEVTGHAHEVVADAAIAGLPSMHEYFEEPGTGRRILMIAGPHVLRHEEHGAIMLDPAAPAQVRQGDVLLNPIGRRLPRRPAVGVSPGRRASGPRLTGRRLMAPKQQKYELTPEHRAQLEPWRDKWIANAFATGLMSSEERAQTLQAVRELYRAAGLTPPPDRRIVIVPSPTVARFTGGFAAAIWWRRKNPHVRLRAATGAATEAATEAATGAATEAEVLKTLEERHPDADEIRIRSAQAQERIVAARSDKESADPREPLERFFAFAHLPPHLMAVSKPFGDLATHIITTLPRNPERTVALRKLLEAKDCAVRSLL